MDKDLQRRAAEQDADPRVDLAVQRTALAEDRTFLAWLRTSLAFMGAGVAFDKGTQLLHEQRLAAGTALVESGHFVGISLTAVTTVLLLFVLWQHRRTQLMLAKIKETRATSFPPTAIAGLLAVSLGLVVLFVLMI